MDKHQKYEPIINNEPSVESDGGYEHVPMDPNNYDSD